MGWGDHIRGLKKSNFMSNLNFSILIGQVFHNLAATLPTDFILKYGGVNLDLLNLSLIHMPNLLKI